MIGKNQLTLDASVFTQGLSTSDYIPDGGIGASSYNLNLLPTPGVLRATPSTATTGDSILDQVIASCEDPITSTSPSAQRIILDASGNYYKVDPLNTSTNITKKVTDSTSSYDAKHTDLVGFAGYGFATSSSNVAKLDTSSSWSVDATWWTVTKSESALSSAGPHPLLVYESYLWIADFNALHFVDGSLTTTTNKLTLNSNEVIYALGIDPGTGLMLIGIRALRDLTNGDLRTARNFIGLYDGYSSKLRRKVPVDGMATGFHNVGGTVFVLMGNTIGVWNGNGVTFLRRLSNSGVVYKSKLTSVHNTLYVADGPYVLAFGDVANGKKIWYPFYKNQTNSNDVDFISFAGLSTTSPEHPNIFLSHSTTSSYLIDVYTTSTTGTGVYYSNYVNFPRPVNIHKVRVLTTGITSSNGGSSGIGGLAVVDEKGTANTAAVSTFKVASGTQYVFDFDYGSLKCLTAQIKAIIDTQAFAIVRIIVYYDPAE